MIDSFIARLENKRFPKEDVASKDEPLAMHSPAVLVNNFFRTHPILAPKVTKISWPNAKTARIELDNFPIEQMPEFARMKFEEKIDELVSNLPEGITIELYDITKNKTVLSKTKS